MDDPQTEEHVRTLCEVMALSVETDGHLVRTALQQNSNNLDKVMEEYFQDPVQFQKKYTWDESAFGADREGGNNTTGISFSVDSPDNAIIQGVTPPPENGLWPGSGAPTRPPSRTNTRSPLGAPNTSAQEDEDLARALRMSAAESNIPQQESGVVETVNGQPHFGPANRDTYEAEQWAVVPTGTTTQTGNGDQMTPSIRKRTQDAPAFLVQQSHAWSSENRLGAIMTILHEIPAARNTLLQAGKQAPSYGNNPSWWSGEPIYSPQALAALQHSGDSSSPEVKPDFHEEIHRLMAFLDSTDRSYGSSEVLSNVLSGNVSSLEQKLFDTLLETNDPATLQPLLTEVSSILTATFNVIDQTEKFSFLDFELNANQWAEAETFYDIWDSLAWDDAITWQELHDSTKMTIFNNMGDVMTLQLNGDCQKPIEIPEVWYPERYLDARKEEARTIQEHLAWVLKALYEGMGREHELNNWTDPQTGKVHNRRDLLAQAVTRYEGFAKYLNGLANFQNTEDFTEEQRKNARLDELPPIMIPDEETSRAKAEKILERCKEELNQHDAKLQKLNAERDQLRQYRKHLGKLLTDPDNCGTSGPFVGKKYLLRGVATARNVIYVCRREESDLIDMGDSPSQPSDQWWRLAYTAGDQKPAKAEKVEIELVKRHMFQETKTPLLVYATEDGLNAPRVPISDALQRFVKADNKSFRGELNREEQDKTESAAPREEDPDETNVQRASDVSPMSPSKRKHRADSIDSMATNRASIGSASDTNNSRAGDFADDFGGPATEMVEYAKMPTEQWLQLNDEQTVAGDEAEQSRAPEMQERGGNNSIFGSRRSPTSTEPRSDQKRNAEGDMNMDDVLGFN